MRASWRWRSASLASSVACLALALPTATAFASFPGENGRIGYSSGDGRIHTILPWGRGDVSTGQVGWQPQWSPDGQRIAYNRTIAFDPNRGSKDEIFSMAQDGSDVRRLTYLAGWGFPYLRIASYSPNGRRIAFDKVGGPSIMVMRSDGSHAHRIHSGSPFEWSPDGRWISYIVGSNNSGPPSIWVVHPNGTDAHRLVRVGSEGGWLSDYAPSGKRFIFVRSREISAHWFHYTTLVARADGSNVHRLPCDDGSPPMPFDGGVFSPNGYWLLGMRPSATDENHADFVKLDLHECRAGNVAYKVIATGIGVSGGFDWQPLPTG
jgi:dipeptidyl aminopeptidase/acylaminoacyl peptidase